MVRGQRSVPDPTAALRRELCIWRGKGAAPALLRSALAAGAGQPGPAALAWSCRGTVLCFGCRQARGAA